jgi:hypothetical protein
MSVILLVRRWGRGVGIVTPGAHSAVSGMLSRVGRDVSAG